MFSFIFLSNWVPRECKALRIPLREYGDIIRAIFKGFLSFLLSYFGQFWLISKAFFVAVLQLGPQGRPFLGNPIGNPGIPEGLFLSIFKLFF